MTRPVLLEHPHLPAFEGELADRLIHGHRVAPAETGSAVVVRRVPDAMQHPLDRQVVKRIDFEVVADLLDRALVGDELVCLRKINAEKAGVPNRRAGDPKMNLLMFTGCPSFNRWRRQVSARKSLTARMTSAVRSVGAL